MVGRLCKSLLLLIFCTLSHSWSLRRDVFLKHCVLVMGTSCVATNTASAIVTDETDRFAQNWWESPATQSSNTNKPESSDLVNISVSKSDLRGGLGLELADIEFRTNLRVFVKSVLPGSLAEKLGISKDWIVVAINGASTERTNAQGVRQMLSQELASNPNDPAIVLTFRDPAVFSKQLQNLSEEKTATTQVAPGGDTTQRTADGGIRPGYTERSQADQQITVTQLIPPKLCRRGATTDDLLEISYRGTVVETGQVFDGSAIKIDGQGVAGRGDDVTLYFVLGKQPFGQFPPGWDVGMVGQCVGERRRLMVPPALGFGSQGNPRRNIPPNATLQYDITLVSINGLSTPQ